VPRYRVTYLGDFGYLGPNDVTAVNETVEVVGWNIVDSEIIPGGIRFITRGYRWADGAVEPLASLPGAEYCWAEDLNDDGLIVGRAQLPDRTFAGCLLVPGQDAQAIPLSGGRAVSANAINRFGLVVGGAVRDDGQSSPFTHDLATGQSRFIDIPDGAGSAVAVNDSGILVGQFQQTGAPSRPFVSWPGQTAIDLNTLLPAGSDWVLEFVYDINNAGVIVGKGRHAGRVRAFRGTFQGLDPELLAPLEGDLESHAAAINDDGLAVGYSLFFQIPMARWTAVVWDTGAPVNINAQIIDSPPDLWFEGIRSLNNRGHLVARGVADVPRPYLLTPVCAEDMNGDGIVELADLAAFLPCFGGSTCGDLDGDGEADLADLARLLARFGGPCP
jgi:hypothetical protein